MTSAFPNLPVPQGTATTHTFGTGGGDQTSPQDLELLYSTVGVRKYGVTLAAGQGILPIGTVLARKTSDKKYYVYNNSGSGGLEIATCVLYRACDTGASGAKDQLANAIFGGALKNDLVSGADSGAITDLGAIKDVARNIFRF